MIQAGAIYKPGKGCSFTLWAPEHDKATLHIVKPIDKEIPMQKDKLGYFTAMVPEAAPGWQYYYQCNGAELPDPASFSQPEGVAGPSEVTELHYAWTDDAWKCPAIDDFIIYELHIGTFTPPGTFEAAIERLDDLAAIGINAIEIMPVAQFPGKRNWGYDGVFPYATQNSYGGPKGLQKLVDACHNRGIAVILDVVYNHLGPEGNCLPHYAPYFTDKYKTPWGQAINFDEAWSDGVRHYFINNALYWLQHYHIDALRLDAIHEMYDFGATHLWEQLHHAVAGLSRRTGRELYLIAESDLNNPKVVKHPDAGGYGFNAQWLDDFHHALYVLLDKDGAHRYTDFGKTEQLAKAYSDGFVHSGDYVNFRQKTYGASTAGLPGNRFIVFNQNHDQVGNTVDGRRLASRLNQDLQKVASAALLLAPYIPMLFMGEEYGAEQIFTYFIDHNDKELTEAVRKGRKEEFGREKWTEDTLDPAGEETYQKCILNWNERNTGWHATQLQWNTRLLQLRKSNRALRNYNKNYMHVYTVDTECIALHRWDNDSEDSVYCIINISGKDIEYNVPGHLQSYHKTLDSGDYGGNTETLLYPDIPGATLLIPAQSACVYVQHA